LLIRGICAVTTWECREEFMEYFIASGVLVGQDEYVKLNITVLNMCVVCMGLRLLKVGLYIICVVAITKPLS
jgi:hypothetical protein